MTPDQYTQRDIFAFPLSGLTRESGDAFDNLNRFDKGRYSLRDIICQGVSSEFNDSKVTLERELSEDARRKLVIPGHNNGFFIPRAKLYGARDSFSTVSSIADTSSDSALVQATVQKTIIPGLPPVSIMERLGARKIQPPKGSFALPVVNDSSYASSSGYSEDTQIIATKETFSQQTASPCVMAANIPISRNIALQTSFDAEAVISSQIQVVISKVWERYVLTGTGTDGGQTTPVGILSATENSGSAQDPTKLSPGVTFGATASLANVLKFPFAVETANAEDDGTFGFALSPSAAQKWRQTTRSASTAKFLIDQDGACGYRYAVTSFLSASNKAIFARWSDVLLLEWAVEIVPNPFVLAHQNMILLQIYVYGNWAPIHGPAIVRSEDSAAQ